MTTASSPVGVTLGHLVKEDGKSVFMTPESARRIRNSGASIVRAGLRLGSVKKAWDAEILRTYADAVENLHSAGLQVVLNIGSEAFPAEERYSRQEWLRKDRNTFVDEYVRLAMQLIKALPEITIFELWNEPNVGQTQVGDSHSCHWYTDPKTGITHQRLCIPEKRQDGSVAYYFYDRTYLPPAIYGAMIAGVHEQLRDFRRTTQRVQYTALGGIFASNADDGIGYITAVYKSPAVVAYRKRHNEIPVDFIGHHPYYDPGTSDKMGKPGENVEGSPNYNGVRKGVFRQHLQHFWGNLTLLHAPHQPPRIIATEVGWNNNYVSNLTAASNIKRMYDEVGDDWRYKAILVYKWDESPAESERYGLIDFNGTPRPALKTFTDVAHLRRCPSGTNGGEVFEKGVLDYGAN